MKKLLFGLSFVLASLASSAQEYKIITTIESVVPGGLGRSRMIQTDENGKSDEKEMKNFFSMVGLNFGNVVENDQMIAEMLTRMAKDGWELEEIVTGVYSAESSTGIFITRYIFVKE